MKFLLVILLLLSQNFTLVAQDSERLFSDAIRNNFSKFKQQSNKAYKAGDFDRGQFLFDSLVQNQLVGSKFNDFTLKRVSNRKLKMSRVKKPIFLVTYAAWCIPGKGEIFALNKLAKEYSKEVEFVVIVWGKKQEVKKFAKKFSGQIEICYAHKYYKNDNEIVENMKETLGFPTCYMLDSNLQVVNIKRGAASVPFKTPNKKAIDMNYKVFKERIIQLNSKEMLATF